MKIFRYLLLISLIVSGTAAYSQSGTWTTASSIGFTPRSALTSCVVNNMIYVMGGYNGSSYYNTLEVFDPNTNTWSTPSTTGTFTARRGLACSVVDGKIYVMGGYNGSTVLNTLEVFDPSTNVWSTPKTTGTFTAREKLCSSVVNNKIYAMGGFDGNTHLNTLEVFDPATNIWSTPATTGTFTPRRGITSCVVGGKIFVMGGYNGTLYLNTVEVFDPSSNVWSTPATTGTFTARGALCSGVVGNTIYAMGGIHLVSGNYVDVNTVEVLDPSLNLWSTPETTGSFTPRYELTCSEVNGMIYVMGGTNTGVVLNTNEVFTPQPSSDAKSNSMLRQIELFPNPTGGIVTVRNAPANIMHVTVTNIIGESLIELADPNAMEFMLDLSKLPPGSYFVRFSMAEGITTRKILKE